MATIRLTPSTYYLSNSSYLTVSNAGDMYDDTDSSTYGTVTNSYNGTSSYYIYLRGFNFDDIPSGAVVERFEVKFKARETGVSTTSSYRPYLCHGTSTITGSTTTVSTSATVHTFTGVTATWETISGYGDTFGIRFNCRRASRNTTSYMYIYGAEIEVEYTVPVAATVTSTVTGDGTISPSGETSTFEGKEFTLTITPTDKSASVTATNNGTDVTAQLVAHGAGATLTADLGTFTHVSGSFNGSGQSYFSGIVGNGVDASKTSSNYYCGSSSQNCVFTYDMGIDLPSGAVIEECHVEVNGHAESASNSSEYMCVQLKSGTAELTEQVNFKEYGTSNTTITLECTTLPTVSQAASMVLECELGYYGGAINGATVYLTYSVGSGIDHYTYTYIVSGDAVIAVTIGGGGAAAKLYKRVNGAWILAAKGYMKNSTWAAADAESLFDEDKNYMEG